MITNTGIKATENVIDILHGVLGQLSDGIWENSRHMEKYWKSLHVTVGADGNVVIEDRHDVCKDVKRFFANKIKQVIQIEHDDGDDEIVWSPSCTATSGYLHGHVPVSECYQLYQLLRQK